MRVEDEFELLKTLHTSDEMIFSHERHRVELALLMQLGGITGNRPPALLAVHYGHVKVTLIEDPNGGKWPRVLIEIAYKCTKSFLGPKDTHQPHHPFHPTFETNVYRRNEFGIADIPNETCPLLCPQTTLFALIFSTVRLTLPRSLYQSSCFV